MAPRETGPPKVMLPVPEVMVAPLKPTIPEVEAVLNETEPEVLSLTTEVLASWIPLAPVCDVPLNETLPAVD